MVMSTNSEWRLKRTITQPLGEVFLWGLGQQAPRTWGHFSCQLWTRKFFNPQGIGYIHIDGINQQLQRNSFYTYLLSVTSDYLQHQQTLPLHTSPSQLWVSNKTDSYHPFRGVANLFTILYKCFRNAMQQPSDNWGSDTLYIYHQTLLYTFDQVNCKFLTWQTPTIFRLCVLKLLPSVRNNFELESSVNIKRAYNMDWTTLPLQMFQLWIRAFFPIQRTRAMRQAETCVMYM